MDFQYLSLYLNERTGDFIVQPQARHPTGASADFGDPTVVSPKHFDSRMVAVVLENLGKYSKQVFLSELAPRYSNDEHRKFVEEHLCVDLTRFPTGELRIRPCHRATGGAVGYVGHDEDTVILHPDQIHGMLAS